jgi:hypothetical protein
MEFSFWDNISILLEIEKYYKEMGEKKGNENKWGIK